GNACRDAKSKRHSWGLTAGEAVVVVDSVGPLGTLQSVGVEQVVLKQVKSRQPAELEQGQSRQAQNCEKAFNAFLDVHPKTKRSWSTSGEKRPADSRSMHVSCFRWIRCAKPSPLNPEPFVRQVSDCRRVSGASHFRWSSRTFHRASSEVRLV